MTFRIMCEVSGGVTGYRSGYFKENGEIVIFPSLEMADIYRDQLASNAKATEHYAKATYRYTVEDTQLAGEDAICSECGVKATAGDIGFGCQACLLGVIA